MGSENKELYWIALSMVPGIGCKTAHQLLEVFEDPENLFMETRKGLEAIFAKRTNIIDAILSKSMFAEAEKEIKYASINNVKILTYNSPEYPQRLKRAECSDNPIVLYYRGTANLNSQKIISIVGTRKATDYGRRVVEELIADVKNENVMIVSGLAYGVDTLAHRMALQNGLPTVGVLGHGLDMIYPNENVSLAREMLGNGGLLTEYMTGTKIDPHNFPSRNRIIAALSDAVVVIEAAKKGGALITAEVAGSYNRDVFAVPGKVCDQYSEGCNNLIKNNKAHLMQSAQDLFYIMGWKKNGKRESVQTSMFVELTPEQKIIYDLLLQNRELTLDEISLKCELSLPKIASILLTLELKNIIKCLPGKMYKIM